MNDAAEHCSSSHRSQTVQVLLLVLGALWGLLDESTGSRLGAAADEVAAIDPKLFLEVEEGFLTLLE